MILEIWKPVIGYEDRYEVSNFGRVKSLHTNSMKYNNIHYKSSYCSVALYRESAEKRFSVHRLVALAFIPNPQNKPTVNHINGIKDDNRVENLEWATYREQRLHANKLGLRVISDKEKAHLKSIKEIVCAWVNEKLNLEFKGSATDLVKAFPDLKLNVSGLCHVRRREYKNHKGWTIKF